MGRRILAALIDLVPLTLLLLGFAERWGELGRQPNGSFGVSLHNTALLVFMALAFGFYWFQEAAAAMTFGKWIVGLRVVTPEGHLIGSGAAAKRTAMRVIDGLPMLYLVGFVSALVDKQRRRLGDKVAKCVVVAFRWADLRPGTTARRCDWWCLLRERRLA